MNLYKKIGIQYKCAFFSALVFGLISQGMGMFNKFSWHDDAVCLFSVGTTFASGRWMLGFLEQLDMLLFGSQPTSLPLTNGLVSLLMLGLSACLFIALLKITHPAASCFVGGTMAAFPAITGLFGFVFTLPYYVFGILLASAGAYLICRGKNLLLRIAGIPLITMSIGIYQAYFSVALCGILFYFIAYGMEEAKSTGEFIGKGLLAALALVISMLLYFLCTNLSLTLYHTALNDYMGIDQMGKSSISVYLERVLYAYRVFFSQDASTPYYMYARTSRRVYLVIALLSLAASPVLILRHFRRNKVNAFLSLVLVCLIPLAANFVFVMADPNDVHSLMTYGQVYIFVYFAWVIDRIQFRKVRLQQAVRGVGLALLLLINIMFFRYDNQCYLKAALSQQEAISYFTTMVTQIKSAEGYDDRFSVYVVNDFQNQDETITHYGNLDHVTQHPYGGLSDYLNNYNWKYFVRNWCGFSPDWKNGDELLHLPEVQNMTHYPDDGSIRVIDDKVVIRF